MWSLKLYGTSDDEAVLDQVRKIADSLSEGDEGFRGVFNSESAGREQFGTDKVEAEVVV